jgi:serine/threonine protein kinase/formylglycine-generating enzyme required for sulfatase activity
MSDRGQRPDPDAATVSPASASPDAATVVPAAKPDPGAATAVPANRPDPEAPTAMPAARPDADAPTVVPANHPDAAAATVLAATRPTVAPAGGPIDPQATFAATQVTELAPGAAATLPVAGSQTVAATTGSATSATAATMVAGGGQAVVTAFADGTQATTGATRPGTGTFANTRRLGRTRVNDRLPADDRDLDLKLQMSRPSVLAEMAQTMGPGGNGGQIPPGIAKLLAEHGTEGRYTVNRPLAKGGMGAVLEIKDGDFSRPAAMKVMLSQHAKRPDMLERFLDEAQVTAQLEHPNIVPIHDMGVMHDGTIFFTMKLIEGQSLGRVVKDLKSDDPAVRDAARAKWTVEELLLTFLKVLDGVGYAHSRGVVHRDIKPDNLMLGLHGEVLVVDWGIAKVLGKAEKAGQEVVSMRDADALSATMAGSAMGTLFYMPPEQATGELEQIDARSDIYALGATLYELLSTKRPIAGSTTHELLAAVMEGRQVPLKEVAPQLDDDLIAIVHKAMAPAPAMRYRSCEEFADDLRRFLAGQGALARQRNLIERIGRWISSHRKQVIAGSAAAAVLAAAIAGTSWYNGQAERERLDRLLGEAQSAVQAKDWEAARDKAQGVLANRPGDRTAQEIKTQAAGELAMAQMAAEERAKREANQKKAAELLAEAQVAKGRSAWQQALELARAALAIEPSDEATALVERAASELADTQRAKLRREAQANKDAGDAVLAKAKSLSSSNPLDPAITPLLDEARKAYALSAKDGISVDGLDAAIAKVASLDSMCGMMRDQHAKDEAAAAEARKRMQQAAEGVAAAGKQLAAGELDAAAESVAAARKLDPTNTAAIELRDRILAALAQRDAAKATAAARAEAERTATAALATVKASWDALVAAKNRLGLAQLEVATLERRLLDAPLAQKSGLIQARTRLAAANAAIAQHWSEVESAASSARQALIAHPDHPLAAEARDWLLKAYGIRLDAARASQSLPEVAAYSNLIRRLGVADAAEKPGILRLTGAGKAGLTALAKADDGTFAPVGGETVVELPAERPLPAGRHLVSIGGQSAAVLLASGKTVDLAAPPAPPTIAGFAWRWVPPADGKPGFWLAETETTVAQYAKFITDPATVAAITDRWPRREREGIAPLPRRGRTDCVWQVAPAPDDPNAFGGLSIPKAIRPQMPVTGIDRADALGFCAWLGKQHGRTVRLPTAAEWQRAAGGGDPDRRFPWGHAFDPALATSALPRKETVPPVGATPSDRGPYGHLDLGGSVREWLSDLPTRDDPLAAGVHGSLIAGGAWTDADEFQFRTTFTESVQPEAVNAAIGFRCLIEQP